MFHLYGLHVVFLYCKLTQFSWSKHSLLLKYIVMREYQLYLIYNTSTQYKYSFSCNWIFLRFSTLISCHFTKNILHNDISMTMKRRLMRTYSVVCWTKRDRKIVFFHRKKIIKINYQDTLDQGFNREDGGYCIFDNVYSHLVV